MTGEEKDWENGILRGIGRGIQIFLQSGEDTLTLSVDVEAAKMLAAALREYVNSSDKTPDPETGLVPCCWCGGKAGFHYSVMMRDNDCYVECGVCGEHSKVVLSEDDARDTWNYSMGYRGALKKRDETTTVSWYGKKPYCDTCGSHIAGSKHNYCSMCGRRIV